MVTGYFTLTELVNAKIFADKAKLESARIQDLITSDMATPAKHHMADGVNYYNSEHDILQHKNLYYVDGVWQEDLLKSNYRIPHPFHKILVDQKVAYVVGNPVVVSVAEVDVEDPKNPTPEETKALDESDKFEELLHDRLTNDFDDLLSDWVLGASNKGVEWVHFYVDPDGTLQYCLIPAEQVIPIYDTQYQKDLVYVIRFYTYDLIDEKGVPKQRFKVEWWTKEGVEYFTQTMNNMYVHDPDYEFNPGPHWMSFNTSKPSEKNGNAWGRVPFVALANNSQTHTDLRPVKALIDAYDKVKSGWVNDLVDFQELIYVLKGYKGVTEEARKGYSELGFFVANLKAHKVLEVDSEGGVDTIKAEIPVEAKEKFLAITRKEIFYFGQGVDIDDENLGAASGVALQFRYSGLDLKANRLIRKLKGALSEFMWFIVQDINRVNRTEFDPDELIYTVNKGQVFNTKEKIDFLVASKDMLSEQTILENHPLVDDVEEEQNRLDAEEADRLEKAVARVGVVAPPDSATPGTDAPPMAPAGAMPPQKKNGQMVVAE